MRDGAKIKIRKLADFRWLLLADFTGLICEGNGRFWLSLLQAVGTNGLKWAVLAVHCFLKNVTYIEVQKYLFGINGWKNLPLPPPPPLIPVKFTLYWIICNKQHFSIHQKVASSAHKSLKHKERERNASCGNKQAMAWQCCLQSWARIYLYFLIFSIIKNRFFAFFIKLMTYFCTSLI